MLLLGIYIGGAIAMAFSCWGAATEEDSSFKWLEELPTWGQILGIIVVSAMVLLWPVSMIWMIIDGYLNRK